MANGNNLRRTIDELGMVRKEIEALKLREQELRDSIALLGAGQYDGDRFKANVTVDERQNIDLDAVREAMSPQWLRAHTFRQMVTTVRVFGR